MSKSKNKKYYTSNKTNFIPPKQEQKKDKKGIAFWVLFSLIIFWTIASVLGSLSFFNVNYSSDIPTAKADSVQQDYIFRGNNQFVPTSNYYKNNGYWVPNTTSDSGAGLFMGSFDYMIKLSPVANVMPDSEIQYAPSDYVPFLFMRGSFNRSYSEFNFSYMRNLNNSDDSNFGNAGIYTDTYNSINTDYYNFNNLRWTFNSDTNKFNEFIRSAYYFGSVDNAGFTGAYCLIYSECSCYFNANVVSVTYSSTDENLFGNSYDTITNIITLTDNNDKQFSIKFVCAYNSLYTPKSFLMWENRTYYFTTALSDNDSYLIGKNDGYAQGKQDYEGSGYQDGYNIGKSEGEAIGYNKGVTEANEYSFLSLMGAVVDAPIQALTGFFGFEILGINLLSLLSGLFTLCIIIILIRLLLGGGFSG